jgi:hypothetical protein
MVCSSPADGWKGGGGGEGVSYSRRRDPDKADAEKTYKKI